LMQGTEPKIGGKPGGKSSDKPNASNAKTGGKSHGKAKSR